MTMTMTQMIDPIPLAGTRRAAVLDPDLRCDCGQELDCCAGDHCPRCGHELRPRR